MKKFFATCLIAALSLPYASFAAITACPTANELNQLPSLSSTLPGWNVTGPAADPNEPVLNLSGVQLNTTGVYPISCYYRARTAQNPDLYVIGYQQDGNVYKTAGEGWTKPVGSTNWICGDLTGTSKVQAQCQFTYQPFASGRGEK